MTDSVEIRDLPDRITVRNEIVEVISAGTMGPASLAAGSLITSANDVILGTGVGTATAYTPVFNVRAQGAVGDGVTDDTPAIQATIDLAEAAVIAGASGAVVSFPDNGTYLMNPVSGTGPSSLKVCVYIVEDNITIDVGAATIKLRTGSAGGVVPFMFNGQVKGAGGVAGVADWLDYWVTYPPNVTQFPIYDMDPVAKGATTITLDTAADAANFAAGDAILIRTGQCIPIQGDASEPDGELNEIVSANAGTGVLTLKYPTGKAYAQEYHPSSPTNGVGPTTTSVTAFPALFGVQKVEGSVIRNVKVTGGNWDLQPNTGKCYAVMFTQVMGYQFTGARGNCVNASLQNGGIFRDFLIDVNQSVHSTNGEDAHISTATCCSNGEIYGDYVATGQPYGIPINEGGAKINVLPHSHMNPASASNNHAIQLTGRWYDIRVAPEHLSHVSSGTGNTIYSSSDGDGLIIDAPDLIGSVPSIAGSNVQIRNLSSRRALINSPVISSLYVLACDVYFDSPSTIIMGYIPPRAYVLDTQLYIWTKFTGGTSPTIEVGVDGGYSKRFMNTITLNPGSSVPALQAITREPTTAYYQEPGAFTTLPVEITYTRDGASAGRAMVVMTWAYVPELSGV